MNEIIRLSPKKAKLFGLISKKAKPLKNLVDVYILSITEKKDTITIIAEISNLTKKLQIKTIIYNKKKITLYEATFIGWAFILLDDYKNNYKERAKKFLEIAIKNEIDFFQGKNIPITDPTGQL